MTYITIYENKITRKIGKVVNILVSKMILLLPFELQDRIYSLLISDADIINCYQVMLGTKNDSCIKCYTSAITSIKFGKYGTNLLEDNPFTTYISDINTIFKYKEIFKRATRILVNIKITNKEQYDVLLLTELSKLDLHHLNINIDTTLGETKKLARKKKIDVELLYRKFNKMDNIIIVSGRNNRCGHINNYLLPYGTCFEPRSIDKLFFHSNHNCDFKIELNDKVYVVRPMLACLLLKKNRNIKHVSYIKSYYQCDNRPFYHNLYENVFADVEICDLPLKFDIKDIDTIKEEFFPKIDKLHHIRNYKKRYLLPRFEKELPLIKKKFPHLIINNKPLIVANNLNNDNNENKFIKYSRYLNLNPDKTNIKVGHFGETFLEEEIQQLALDMRVSCMILSYPGHEYSINIIKMIIEKLEQRAEIYGKDNIILSINNLKYERGTLIFDNKCDLSIYKMIPEHLIDTIKISVNNIEKLIDLPKKNIKVSIRSPSELLKLCQVVDVDVTITGLFNISYSLIDIIKVLKEPMNNVKHITAPICTTLDNVSFLMEKFPNLESFACREYN